MAKKRTVIEFYPNSEDRDQLLLHEYLGGLDAGIALSILKIIKDHFLAIAMIKSGNVDDFKIRMAGIESIARLNAQAEIIRQSLAAYSPNFVIQEDRPVKGSSLDREPAVIEVTPDDDDDSWDNFEKIEAVKPLCNFNN